jgi:hypothetical protein
MSAEKVNQMIQETKSSKIDKLGFTEVLFSIDNSSKKQYFRHRKTKVCIEITDDFFIVYYKKQEDLTNEKLINDIKSLINV